MYGWKKNGWKTTSKEDVKNQELWKTLYDLVEERGRERISWHHVRGHVGIPGNERVDDIARELAEGTHVSLYRGTLSDYPVPDILNVPNEEDIDTSTKKNKSTGKAYSYLSLVDGVLEHHATWESCEQRVTGKKAKFKKALSKEHEKEIMREWGFSE